VCKNAPDRREKVSNGRSDRAATELDTYVKHSASPFREEAKNLLNNGLSIPMLYYE
jgi:hypothetical protein